MPLNVSDIRTQKGEFSCNLWENENIDLPLTLFYSIEIPLHPFDTGHDYVSQPTSTSISIDWIKFLDPRTGENIRDWRDLLGKEFFIVDEDGGGQGTIYLGTEHCPFNSKIKFLSLSGVTFDVELTLKVAFNIEAIGLDEDGQFVVNAQISFEGLHLYDNDSLPTFSKLKKPLELISDFINLDAFEPELRPYDNPHVDWRQLKPRI
jgi:hypothetical protein